MSRKLLLVLLIGISALGLLAHRVRPTSADEEGSGGGRIAPFTTSYGWADSLAVGTVFTDGFHVIDVEQAPIEILSVKPRIQGATLVFLGARILGPDRPYGAYQRVDGFPPTIGDLAGSLPVEGFVIPPTPGAESYELLLGYRVTGTGRSTVLGIDITYTSGSQTRTFRIPGYLAICSPRSENECPPEYGDASTSAGFGPPTGP
jgi:hypothetical protein